MTINFFQTPEYRHLMEEHISQTISYLFDKNQEFSVVCEVKHTQFSPELPPSLKETFQETVMFIISGYTFESAGLEDGYFTFEAGFGEENFGSTVSVPLLGMAQIFVGENPIIINHAKPVAREEKNQKEHNKAEKSSMEALLNNPENKKLLKKRT